jgi:two-component system sensor histidine kinase YesM
MNKLLTALQRSSLAGRIKLLIICVTAVVSVFLLVTLFTVVGYSNRYGVIVSNFTVASQFNNQFRSTIDDKLYWFVAGRHVFADEAAYAQLTDKASYELTPLHDVGEARRVVQTLSDNTTSGNSMYYLSDITRQLDALETTILEIQQENTLPPERDSGQSVYNWRKQVLQRRVYPLTEMIEANVLQYIYSESVYMAEVHSDLKASVRNSMLIIVASAVVMFALLFVLALRTASSITRPLRELNENIRLVGEGDFTVRPVRSSNDELQAMSDTLNGMVTRIVLLMDDIRQKQENLRRTELELLQSQITPHFLYNTFDTVIWLAEDNQNQKVVNTVESLSTFFRTSLSKGRNFIRVSEEALHVRSYLEIQQTRYSDILTYELDFPEELDDFYVLKLTLQPLIENALYHGVKNKRESGKIIVSGKKAGDNLRFEVYDDGIGIPPEKLAEIKEGLSKRNRPGFGMSNVQERIQLFYGSGYGLEIESVYTAYTKVTVLLPAQINEPNS